MYSRQSSWLTHILAAAVSTACMIAAPLASAQPTEQAFTVSDAKVRDNLAVYFIHGPSRPGPVPLTLAEALKSNAVTLHETGRVEQLSIENHSDQEVFVQAGDIVKGGRQDRVLTVSLLIPARSGKVNLAAYCVEQGRWSARPGESVTKFSTAATLMPSRQAKIAMLGRTRVSNHRPVDGARLTPSPIERGSTGGSPAPPSLRQHRERQAAQLRPRQFERRIIQRHATGNGQISAQQKVWQNVAKIQRQLAVRLATGVQSERSRSSLQLSLEHQKLSEAREKLANEFRALGLAKRDIVGYAFAINGEVNSVDIYPSNGLFRKMWPKLLAASVTEAIAEQQAPGTAAIAKQAPEARKIDALIHEAPRGKSDRTKLVAKLQRERVETDRVLSLATRRADGSIVHRSIVMH